MSVLKDYVLKTSAINRNVVESIDGTEGGGGSSDFSTAEVTINSEVDVRPVNASIPVLWDDPEYPEISGYFIIDEGELEIDVLLYKGSADIFIPNKTVIDGDSYNLNINVTGDIEDAGDGYYAITGNCLITITLAGG